MSQVKHSPEPWNSSGRSIPLDGVDECPVYDANGKSVVDVAWYENGAENAARIVACVNFCRGIPTEELTKPKAGIRILWRNGATNYHTEPMEHEDVADKQ